MTVTLIVIAKAPEAGRSKTRLCPPRTHEEAASLAAAALADTLDAVAATPTHRRVLVLDGEPGPWLPSGFDILPQRGDGLDSRLAAAFDDVLADAPAPALLIGMDTPHVTPTLLTGAMHRLCQPGVDAVLGDARDGGWWAIGLHAADARVFEGVPMSQRTTARAQRERLRELNLAVADLPVLRDVDSWDDAVAVAKLAPMSRFGQLARAW